LKVYTKDRGKFHERLNIVNNSNSEQVP